VDACIGKPFNPAALLQIVKNVLIKHREFILTKNERPEKAWVKHSV
jgi:hypothetical protein